jgi:hypothetical protein
MSARPESLVTRLTVHNYRGLADVEGEPEPYVTPDRCSS